MVATSTDSATQFRRLAPSSYSKSLLHLDFHNNFHHTFNRLGGGK